MMTAFTTDPMNDAEEDAALDAAREMIEAYEMKQRADLDAEIEEEAMVKPALDAAGLTSFVAWLNAQNWTPKSQHAYDLAIEYALSIYR